MRLVRSTIALLAATVLLAPHASARSTGRAHDAVYFHVLCVVNDFLKYDCEPIFRILEGDVREIELRRDQHGGVGAATVDLRTTPGTASTADYVQPEVVTKQMAPQDMTYEYYHEDIATVEDSEVEGPELVDLHLENATGGLQIASPRDALLSIVDDDGSQRFGFELSNYSLFENRKAVQVTVTRSGVISGSATVDYATSPGTATAPSDYSDSSGQLTFEAGIRSKNFLVPVANDLIGEPDETFSVSLSNPSTGTISEHTTTSVTIHNDDGAVTVDETAPNAFFHVPVHGSKVTQEEAQTIIVGATDDTGGSGVALAQIAIRRNMGDGTCRWWTGNRFQARPCHSKRWVETGGKTTVFRSDDGTWIFTVDEFFKRSVRGSGIKNYTAYARATDNVGNVQTNFVRSQNKNTYEIN